MSQGFRNAGGSMIKDISYSAYIIPVRAGRIAVLKYGENGYGPIGGRLDAGEDFDAALRRELTEELGPSAADLADAAVAVPVPYAFRHATHARALARGAFAEEHHFYIVHIADDCTLNFCENRPDSVSVVWIAPDDLLSPEYVPAPDMRDFYATHVLPNLVCRFSMNLRHTYYEMVKSGQKDIELRLYDEKRRQMCAGDIVLIYDAENPSDYIWREIVHMHIAQSFANLATQINVRRTGFDSLEQFSAAVSKFYTPAQESRYGVVGIELMVAQPNKN